MGIHGDHRADSITVTNCEIGYIGGKTYNASTRFGNAIELWNGTTNLNISNNWIYQTFDSAITWQGDSGLKEDEPLVPYENITVKNNLFEYNNADIEYWESAWHTLKNVLVEGNIMRFTALGWGTRVDDGGVRGIEGAFVGTSTHAHASNVSFKNNIIDCPARQIIKWDLPEGIMSAFNVSGNKYYVKKSYRSTDLVFNNQLKAKLTANNLTELKSAFSEFDPSGEMYWYD